LLRVFDMKKLIALALMTASLAIPIGSAWALRIAPPPGPSRVATSEVIFLGRVMEFEPVDVDAKQFPNAKETAKYRIAIVKVTEVIRGLKDEKTIRVGFVPPPAEPKPGVPRIGGGFRGPTLEAGQEGLFMINKHHEGKFYQAPDFGYFVSSQDKNLDKEIKTAKKVIEIMGNTTKALKSDDADERLLAASILIAKYRTPKVFPNKEEPIDAEESKLILSALANAKWTPVVFGQPNPQQLFFQLGIGPNDGWKVPARVTNPDDFPNAIKGWIRDHGDYRIKKYVPAASEK